MNCALAAITGAHPEKQCTHASSQCLKAAAALIVDVQSRNGWCAPKLSALNVRHANVHTHALQIYAWLVILRRQQPDQQYAAWIGFPCAALQPAGRRRVRESPVPRRAGFLCGA
jgi:hypothetical protein